MIGTKRLMAAALGLALLSGCIKQPSGEITPYVPPPSSGQPSDATTTPTATPTVTPTQAKAELLAEAEKTYRAYVVELLKLEAMGGSDNLTPGMDQYLMEPYREVVRQAYADVKAHGSTMIQAERVELKSLVAIDETTEADALVGIKTCLDYSKAVIVEADGTQYPGVVVVRSLYFKRDTDGRLKMFSGNAKEVSSC